MNQGWVPLALLAGGLAGGFAIARTQSGARAGLAWLLWLAVPFVILAGVLVSQIDPSLAADRTGNNLAFGFVLVGIMLAVPWFPANLLGAWLGRRSRRDRAGNAAQPQAAAAPLAEAAVLPSAHGDVPNWARSAHRDESLPDMVERMRALASQHGVAADRLPTISPPNGADGTFLWPDRFDYQFVGIADGRQVFADGDVVPDRLIYTVFKRIFLDDVPDGPDRQQQVHARLAAMDPLWGNYFNLACERMGKVA